MDHFQQTCVSDVKKNLRNVFPWTRLAYWLRKTGRGIDSVQAGKEKKYFMLLTTSWEQGIYGWTPPISTLTSFQSKNKEFPFSAAISIIYPLKQEGEGRLWGSEHHLSSINLQTADDKTDDKNTQMYMCVSELRGSPLPAALFSGNLGKGP